MLQTRAPIEDEALLLGHASLKVVHKVVLNEMTTKEDKENLPSVHKIYSVVEMTKS